MARVLIVDDESSIRTILKEFLTVADYDFSEVGNADQAIALLEEALKESEDRFRATLEATPIVIWNQDIDLCYTWIHNSHPDFKAEELIGQTDLELLPADDGKHLTEIKRKVIESGVGTREEVRTTIKGESFFYDLIVNPMRDSSGAVIGIRGTSNDITERKQAEELLRESEEKFKTSAEFFKGVTENTSDIILIVDKMGIS